MLLRTIVRATLIHASLAQVALTVATSTTALAQSSDSSEFTVSDIRLEGLQRISEGTVYNYLPVNIGDRLDHRRIQEALRAMYATGFFRDVEVRREGSTLVVAVLERASIESFELKGNKDIKTEDIVHHIHDHESESEGWEPSTSPDEDRGPGKETGNPNPKSTWAVILNTPEQNPFDTAIDDGWNRLQHYVKRGMKTIPTVWYGKHYDKPQSSGPATSCHLCKAGFWRDASVAEDGQISSWKSVIAGPGRVKR